MITEFFDVELIPDARAERHNEGIEFVVSVDFIRTSLFDVQHLAPHGKDRLKTAVPALYGRACGGVALDDVDFAKRRIPLVAVLQLVGHLAAFQAGFAPDGFPCLAGGFSGAVCHHGLFKNGFCRSRMFLKIFRQLFVYD